MALFNAIVCATKYHSSKVFWLEVSCGNGQVCRPGIFYNLAPRGFARHHCTDTSKMRNKRRGINILHYPVACLMHEARKGNVLQESQLVIFYKHESKDQTTVMQIQILQFGIITSFDSAYCTLQFKKTLTCCTLYFQTCFSDSSQQRRRQHN